MQTLLFPVKYLANHRHPKIFHRAGDSFLYMPEDAFVMLLCNYNVNING